MNEATDLSTTLALVSKAQEGDSAALNEICRRYQQRLQRVIRVRLGPQLRRLVDDEDILQETLLAAIQSFDHFSVRSEATLLNWLSRIAERQILHAARFHSAKKRAGPEVEPGQTTLPGGGPTPTQALAHAESTAAVDECLGQLPEHLREIIVLREFLGASWEEVAVESGRPSPDAARKMHRDALSQLDHLVRRRLG